VPLSTVLGAQSLIKPGVCTSSTRPASPFEGQMIYETDTDKVLVYNGTAWYPNWNTAWGQVGYVSKTSDTNLTTTTVDITGLSITWTAISGRIYKISFDTIARTSAAGNIYINATVTDSSNTIKKYFRNGASSTDFRFSLSGFLYETGLSGSTTRKMRSDCSASTAMLEAGAAYPTQFIVEDIGPA